MQFISAELRIFLFSTLLLMILKLTILSFPQRKEFIGYRHRGVTYGEMLPNGAKDLGGGLLSDTSYGVTRFSRGEAYMLWLEKIIDRNSSGIPNWEVKDYLSFNNLQTNQEFLFSYSSTCTQNNRKKLDLIVMAERDQPNKRYKLLKAWRANIKQEKFQEVSLKGISCTYGPFKGLSQLF